MMFHIRKMNMPIRATVDGAAPPTLNEKDVITYCNSKIVHYLRLEQKADAHDRNYFMVWVKGSWSDKEHLLITHNKKQGRKWYSLDRAVLHIQESYNYKGRIYLDI